MYAKFVSENQIEAAPVNYNGWVNFDKDKQLMTKAGYMPVEVVEEACPEKPRVSYRLQNGRIEQYVEAVVLSQDEINLKRIAELQGYLNATDWYAVRFAETGAEIPEEIKAARQSAREEISRLRGDDDQNSDQGFIGN